MTLTAVLNQTFVELWVGAETFGGQSTSVLMAFALWTAAISYVAYDALLARGEFQFISRVFIASSAMHVTVLFALLPYAGLTGAPATVLIATCVWGVPMWLRIASTSQISRRQLAGSFKDSVLIASIAAAAGLLFALCYPKVSTWGALFWEAATCATAIATL